MCLLQAKRFQVAGVDPCSPAGRWNREQQASVSVIVPRRVAVAIEHHKTIGYRNPRTSRTHLPVRQTGIMLQSRTRNPYALQDFVLHASHVAPDVSVAAPVAPDVSAGLRSAWHQSRGRALWSQRLVRSQWNAPRAGGLPGRSPTFPTRSRAKGRAMPSGTEKGSQRLSHWSHWPHWSHWSHWQYGSWTWSIWEVHSDQATAATTATWPTPQIFRSFIFESRGWWGRWRSGCIEQGVFLLNEIVRLLVVLLFPMLPEPAFQRKVLSIYGLGVPRLPVPQWANVATIYTLYIQRAGALLSGTECRKMLRVNRPHSIVLFVFLLCILIWCVCLAEYPGINFIIWSRKAAPTSQHSKCCATSSNAAPDPADEPGSKSASQSTSKSNPFSSHNGLCLRC